MNPTHNPLSLSIGQQVVIKCYSKVDYDENGNKTLQKIPSKPKLVVKTGIVKRALGTYNAASRSYSYMGDADDYVQAYLAVDKYIYLYETREKINSPARLVSSEDITIIKDQISIPRI